jgi:hypothetical protein
VREVGGLVRDGVDVEEHRALDVLQQELLESRRGEEDAFKKGSGDPGGGGVCTSLGMILHHHVDS